MGCCSSRPETLNSSKTIPLSQAPILQTATPRLKLASSSKIESPLPTKTIPPLQTKDASPLLTKPESPVPAKLESPVPAKPESPIPAKPESPLPEHPAPSSPPAIVKPYGFEVTEGYNYLSSPQCPNGHPYQWRSDIAFYYYESTGSWNIYCHGCTKTFSKPCWSCTDCRVNLCSKCGLQVELKKPSIKCTRDHKLKWGAETCAYYSSKDRESVFGCRRCKKKFEEPSWTCRKCEFDVCMACGRKENMIPPKNLLVCGQKHALTLYNKKEAKNVCEECKIPNKKYYGCNACKYVLCNGCGIKKGSLMKRHPGITCKSHHKEMAIIENKSDAQQLNSCRICNKSNQKYGFTCVECDDLYMYCIDCASLIGEHCEKFSGNLKRELPAMEWKLNKSDNGFFTCKVCNKHFNCHGFFNSTEDVKVCLHDIPSLDPSFFS